MRKPRQFRPMISDSRLEERVVLSVSASQVPAAVFNAPSHKPVATAAAARTTLNQLHSAILGYQNDVTSAILYTEAQIAAGRVSQASAINLLEAYLGNKTSKLFVQTRNATGNLPFGAGYNGYVNSTGTAVSDLPSGSDSLYALLTFPANGTSGPIAAIQNSVFTPLSTGDFNGALKAVNTTGIHSTYSQVKTIVSQYIVNGVKAHDFLYRG